MSLRNMHAIFSGFQNNINLIVLVCVINSFSFPWPKEIGVVEALLAVALVFAFYKGYILLLYKLNLSYLFVLVFIMLFVIGVLSNPLGDVIRDMISYTYLGIPLAFYYKNRLFFKHVHKNSNYNDVIFLRFLVLFSCTGLLYSLRAIWPFIKTYGLDLSGIYKSQLFPHTDYIFLDPSLVFGASFICVYGISKLKYNDFSIGLLYLILSLLIIAAPFFATIRAPVSMYVLIALSAIIFTYKYKSLMLLPGIIIIIYLFSGLAENMLIKHNEVGGNAKIDEVVIIVNYMLEQPIYNILFGSGFGSVYYSPILETYVRFSHNVFSYGFFKGGIALLLVITVLFIWIVTSATVKLIRAFKVNDTLAFASLISFLASFLISTLLEPGYKTLDFGLLMIVYVYFVFFRGVQRPSKMFVRVN